MVEIMFKKSQQVQFIILLALVLCSKSCEGICKYTNQNGSCSACFQGFKLINFQCCPCQSSQNCKSTQSAQIKPWMIFLMIFGLIIILTICILCSKKKLFSEHDKNVDNKNQVQQDQPQQSAQYIHRISFGGKWKMIEENRFGDICPICLEKGNVFLNCQHMTHIECWDLWSQKQSFCPLCNQVEIQNNFTIICSKCDKFGLALTLSSKQIMEMQKMGAFEVCDNCNNL